MKFPPMIKLLAKNMQFNLCILTDTSLGKDIGVFSLYK